MRYGSVRRSISLPADSTDGDYSPDGLRESDIDELLAQSGVDLDELFDDDETADTFALLVDESQHPAASSAVEVA